MLSPASTFLSNFACSDYQYFLDMASKAENRSRCPKNAQGSASDANGKQSEPCALSLDSIWKQMEPALDKRDIAFKESVKGVVGALVNHEVARVETKLDSNHTRNDEKFVSMEAKFDSRFDALEANLLQAISASTRAHAPPLSGS